MKPTDEQIKAEAEMKYNSMAKWEQLAFVEGAKWALSQDSTIEKVKELRDQYQKKVDEIVNWYAERPNLPIREPILTQYQKIIEELNAIIESK